MSKRCYRAGDAAEYVGLSLSSLHKLRREGDFPEAVALTPGAVVWLREDLDAWIDRKAGRIRAAEPDGSEWLARVRST